MFQRSSFSWSEAKVASRARNERKWLNNPIDLGRGSSSKLKLRYKNGKEFLVQSKWNIDWCESFAFFYGMYSHLRKEFTKFRRKFFHVPRISWARLPPRWWTIPYHLSLFTSALIPFHLIPDIHSAFFRLATHYRHSSCLASDRYPYDIEATCAT